MILYNHYWLNYNLKIILITKQIYMEKTKRKKTTSKHGFIPQQERSKQTVEKVLKVATKLFTKHGVAAVNLGQIARQANIPTATIYRYYPNKEELIVRLMYDDLNIMISNAQEKLDSARNIEEFTSALLVVLWDTYEEIQDHPFLKWGIWSAAFGTNSETKVI